MKRLNWLVICLAFAGFACGDDDTMVADTGGGGTDTGTTEDTGGEDMGTPTFDCPDDAPNLDTLMGACCSSASNADKQDAPEFRISGLNIESPASLSNVIIAGQLQAALDNGTFNWLIDVTNAGADGEVTVLTGFGRYNEATNSYSFEDEGTEFAPVTTMATLAGETFMAEPLSETVIVPIVDEMTGEPTLSLPLQQLQLESATMSENRDCVGLRLRNGYGTDDARLNTYITIEDARMAMVEVAIINTSLCNVLRGDVNAEADFDCAEIPQADWDVKPDAICTPDGCTDSCDADTDCNAWTLAGGVSSQAVEIDD